MSSFCRPEKEQELAYILLLELLVHQFCFPVRWIETQDFLLGECGIEKIIEIGPSDTLINMAKLTQNSKYRMHDMASSLHREFMSFKNNKEQIYFSSGVTDNTVGEVKCQNITPRIEPNVPLPLSTPSKPAAMKARTVKNVPDIPLQASSVVRAIVGRGLKKKISEGVFGHTIRSLCGGRSTVQNEIVGDLDREFGSLPDSPEDVPLEQLCFALQEKFIGALGSCSQSMIDRMVASKMPGAFNLTTVRDYLRREWGFDHGRQDAILLEAIDAQPPSRIDVEDVAKTFWATVAQSYVAENKLTLAIPSIDSDETAVTKMHVDPDFLQSLQNDKMTLHRQLINIYANQLAPGAFDGDWEATRLRGDIRNLQADLDFWVDEHGPEYAIGVKQKFDAKKVRIYDSAWNWALQDLLLLYYDLVSGAVKFEDELVTRKQRLLLSKSSPRLNDMIKYLSVSIPKDFDRAGDAKQWLSRLLLDSEHAVKAGPLVRISDSSTAPSTVIEADGTTRYYESIRAEPIASPIASNNFFPFEKLGFETTTESVSDDSDTSSDKKDSISSGASVEVSSSPSSLSSSQSDGFPNQTCLSIETKDAGLWRRSPFLTDSYLDTLACLKSRGLSFRHANVLVTGAGQSSIGAAIVQLLLSGGARVIVTTSSYSPEVTRYYQDLFAEFGASGSTLMVLPFNQGSRQDVEALISYIYSIGDKEWDLDHIIPFAAISERTQGIDDINSKTELAHRVMLTNTLRLLGAIKRQKTRMGIVTRPAQVILPLSPNHGVFGNDGLYAESKIGLQTLMQKWHSEDWGEYLSIIGTIIGWTRGTGLMEENDIVSEGIEKLGVRTFSRFEMAANILGLMSGAILESSQLEPIIADLSGGMSLVSDLNQQVVSIRREIFEQSSYRKALASEKLSVGLDILETRNSSVPILKRANIKFDFPRLPYYETEIQSLTPLQGMIDLERVVVVTGFAEVGPYGNSRTRWEMEAYGKLSLEGCIELAWIMGLIEHDIIPNKSYSGWVDKKTREPINDLDVKSKYEHFILDHTGIRFIEPRGIDGVDPRSKQFLHEIIIQEDLQSFEASKETAQDFLREHGVNAKITQIESSERFQVTLRKGARLLVPKALNLTGFVGGQLPTGWDAETYGISKDIINQVDPTTLYTLVCAAEALISSGITDPYELYKYIHVSELGCCIGSGVGGVTSQQNMYRERMLDAPVANDVLAEGFINSASAWINMLLLSSSGPNITPVGACATAIESMSVGYDLITTGKAKTVLVGGYDWIGKDTSYEFAKMKATINAAEDLACGRSPKEMSRPTTSTRNGFVESEGCGIQVLTTAKLAIEMGLPIHGIVALAHTAFDKLGRSLPAPGQGILTTSRERHTQFDPPLLNMTYRRRCISLKLAQIKEIENSQLEYLQAELDSHKSNEMDFDITAYEKHRRESIRSEAVRETQDTLNTYGNSFWKSDDRISPIRGALATWGLTIDDLDVASFHGTSTIKNEINESDVIQKQLTHLGRKAGNPILSVCQKSLTGHPKGAAGAWMFNGGLQILETGLIPGNRNADNIESELEKYDRIVFPNRNIQKAGGVKAFSVTSFGFGQKGAQAIGVHPKYLFATLSADEYAGYCQKVGRRQARAYEYFHKGLVNRSMFVAKDEPPYSKDAESSFLCDPSARLSGGI